MKKLLTIPVLVAAFSLSAMAGSWVGYISESGCGAKHVKGNASDIACVKGCVKKGSKPVFVTDADHQVIPIENPDKVMDHLGEKVKVTGNIDANKLTVDTVETAQ